jgi:superfamily II DNA helicase RecQ
MADQVSSLRHRGVEAAIMSSKCATVVNFLATERDFHTCSFLFGSPEALISSKWRELIDTADRIVAVVIDEENCVSKW